MIIGRFLRTGLMPLLITLVVLYGQKLLVSAEHSSAVDRTVPTQGSSELSLTSVARASGVRTMMGGTNNDCTMPQMIGEGPTPYSTLGNTTDGLEHFDLCQFDGQTYHDDWFTHIATCTGDLTASTCGTADYDTDLVVYAGHHPIDWTCPPGNGPMLGCNDDFPGCAGFTSEVTVGVTSGNWYTIRVGGWYPGDDGTGTLTITCAGGCGDGICGDGECSCGETCENCPSDCGLCEICGDGICTGGENECNCNQDCPGVCVKCETFHTQADFEAFIEEQGETLKGVEDFEEAVLPPVWVDALNDPLCGGVPNAPDSFPFPKGLEMLNICVQSNFEHNPGAPNPRGVSGLAALSAGYMDATSDLVVANFGVDSLDIMFGDPVPPDQQDNHTGVGFNTLSFNGGDTIELQIFDKNNNLLVVDFAAAHPQGFVFWGVWCPNTIGRINIFDFDAANGSEGGDNIQLWVGESGCQHDDECDDGDSCTDDFCDPDDPNADEFGCTHSSTNCDDTNQCTNDACNPDTGCEHTDFDCNDDDACTDDGCDPADGCFWVDVDCDDGDACTIDHCDPGLGCINLPYECDDGNICTDDSCDPDSDECLNIPIDCSDGNPCTEDGCDSDTGCTHDDIDCSDGNPCTEDLCDPDTGCTHEDVECPKGQVCDPANGKCVEDQDPCECVNGRVTLCHIPPGNLGNAHTITVGCAARDKHLAHGDVCGPCEDGDG